MKSLFTTTAMIALLAIGATGVAHAQTSAGTPPVAPAVEGAVSPSQAQPATASTDGKATSTVKTGKVKSHKHKKAKTVKATTPAATDSVPVK
jgi:hypothetical protein